MSTSIIRCSQLCSLVQATGIVMMMTYPPYIPFNSVELARFRLYTPMIIKLTNCPHLNLLLFSFRTSKFPFLRADDLTSSSITKWEIAPAHLPARRPLHHPLHLLSLHLLLHLHYLRAHHCCYLVIILQLSLYLSCLVLHIWFI